MSAPTPDRAAAWVTKRSHFQVSRTEVLPVVFKARKALSSSSQHTKGLVPLAFPPTEVHLSDSLPVVREWLAKHLERMYRIGMMNVKPGSLETPDVLRNRPYRFTVWFEPTAATFALMKPTDNTNSTEEPMGHGLFDGFDPTPQTLHIVGELDD